MRICGGSHQACLLLAVLAGCGTGDESEVRTKAPRPVSVLTLQRSDPSRLERVAGSVKSWKTEQLGFEVPGRVQFVVEPDTRVIGRIQGGEELQGTEATRLAELDDTRYRLQEQSSQAQIDAAVEQKKALAIEVDRVIPAQQVAAAADLRLARTELERRAGLLQRNAISQEEYDRARADWERAQSRVAHLAAQREAKRAESASLDAQIKQLGESLAQAERDVEDCVLYSPFFGQVAEVHVIPGAYVERGQPVVTVQWMDPISVECEVSAAKARQVNYRDMLPIYVAQPDGSTERMLATVYMTDPVADPQTRTFTLTLLARNRQVRTPVPEDMQGAPVVRTDNLWKVLTLPLLGEEIQFIEERAFQEDDQGTFLWKVTNRQVSTLASQTSPKLSVTKIRVARGQRRVPLLGLWTFQELTINEGEPFDPSTDVVAGQLTFAPEIDPESWDGDTILFDQQRWLLRSGDLVSVDLSGGKTPPGFYVPVNAILERSGRTYVFAVESSGGGARVRRVEVEVSDRSGTLRRIEAAGAGRLKAGTRIVADGALFLHDGEQVNVAEEVEVRR